MRVFGVALIALIVGGILSPNSNAPMSIIGPPTPSPSAILGFASKSAIGSPCMSLVPVSIDGDPNEPDNSQPLD